MDNMSRQIRNSGFLTWFMALLVSALLAACGGGGGGGQDPILGGSGPLAGTVPAVTATVPPATTPVGTGVAPNSNLSVTFTKDMDPATINTSTFTLACPAGTAIAGTVAYIAASRVATFSPTANLPANVTCVATVTTGAKDTSGIALASDFTWSFVTGPATDVTAPTVTGTTNPNGATNVATNTQVGATFSEAMNPATITATTFTMTQGATAVPGAVTYTGVSAVFKPAATLAANTPYTLTITTGAKDAAGNALAANYVWSWTTGAAADTTPPTVSGTIHTNGQTNVAVNTKVGATFSEAMNPATITNANFTLKTTASGAAVPGTVSYSGVSAVFIPLSNLAANTNYTVTVKGGAGGVADLAGNPMAGDYVISWTTAAAADTTAPTVTGTTTANGATGVAVNTKAGATFSEGMDPLTITNLTFTLNETVAGTAVAGTTSYSGVTATFAPAANLKGSTRYTATITTGAKDLAGNALAANYVWSWTTAATPDTTAPRVTGTINANGATGVPVNTKVGATFSESMDPLTITNVTFTLKQGTTPVTGTVSYSGVNAVFTPSALLGSTTYTATISTGAKDLAGNAMAANYVWSWTTGPVPDVTAPIVTSTNPPDGGLAGGSCINQSINATFSEAMDPLTITTATFTLAPTATPAAQVVGIVAYDASTNIATFNLVGNLAATTNYTATLKGGVNGVKDLAGNPLAADKVTTFTTNGLTCTTSPALGAIAPFGGFGGSATVTNDGLNSVINGDIGVNAASTKITGLTDSGGNVYTTTPLNNGLVKGLVYTLTAPPGSVAGAAVTQANIDATTAYNSISPTVLLGGIAVEDVAACPSCGGGAPAGPGQLGGRTLPPGIYKSTPGTFSIGALGDPAGNLTLDGGGDTHAVWVFQMAAGAGGKLTVGLTGPATPAVPVQVLCINGCNPKNVFWYVPGGATIGTGSTMVGTLLTDAGVTISTTSASTLTTLNGRAIGLTAAVTMANTVVNVPAP